jgi:hypothetical protein
MVVVAAISNFSENGSVFWTLQAGKIQHGPNPNDEFEKNIKVTSFKV